MEKFTIYENLKFKEVFLEQSGEKVIVNNKIVAVYRDKNGKGYAYSNYSLFALESIPHRFCVL